MADRQHLHQVVVNLMLNAIESTGTRGGLGVKTAVGQQPHTVTVTVWDNGPGFTAELLPKAFDPFVTGKPTGTGLGLSVCRQIVERHGGRIEAHNRAQGGAELTITLPCQGGQQHVDLTRHRRRAEHSPVLS